MWFIQLKCITKRYGVWGGDFWVYVFEVPGVKKVTGELEGPR
jgi:hypothetical protein